MAGCQEKDPGPEIQKELFPYLLKHQNPDAPKCEPSFVTYRSQELTVFCAPLPNASKEESATREMVKSETTSLATKWGHESGRKIKSIVTRFTDEIITEPTK